MSGSYYYFSDKTDLFLMGKLTGKIKLFQDSVTIYTS